MERRLEWSPEELSQGQGDTHGGTRWGQEVFGRWNQRDCRTEGGGRVQVTGRDWGLRRQDGE